MLFSDVLTILSQLVTTITLKVVIDIPVSYMKSLKLGDKCNNLQRRAQWVSVRPEIQTQGSSSASWIGSDHYWFREDTNFFLFVKKV